MICTFPGDECTADDISAFINELLRMREFNHHNVLNMIGMMLKDNQPYAVLPFMANGDLKEYIADPKKVTYRY